MNGTYSFGLAPMEGVSEFPFRLWMAQVSAPAFSSTPFLRATDSYPQQLPENFAPEITQSLPVSYSLIPQVMTPEPREFLRTARLLLPTAEFVDLNCGCPSPNPVSGGAGSSLLRNADNFVNFAREVCEQLPPQSFSIKMRTGFHDTQNFSTLLNGLKGLPLKQLTVHGRTREDRYDGASRWDLIEEAAQSLVFPVVGSGDILGHLSVPGIKATAPGVSKMIIGRGALRNPWIFIELRDHRPVVINRMLLQYALACFALLTEMGLNHQTEKLISLVQKGLWNSMAGTSIEAWRELYDELSFTLFGSRKTWCEWELNRITLGRVKMIWNSMRSSLPDAYFSPLLLRSKSLPELLEGLALLDPANEPLVVQHRPEWDWLYTSSRIKPDSGI